MYRKADDDKINRIGYKSAAPGMARTRRRENALRRRRERKMEDLEAKRLKDSLMEYESRLQEMRQAALKNMDTLEVIQRYTDKSAAGMQKLAEQSLEGVQRVTAESAGGLRKIIETGTSNLDRMAAAREADMDRTSRECAEKLEQISAAGEEAIRQSAASVEQLEQAVKEHLEKMQELMKQSDDFTHKENVKVYRNVQAVVVEEVKKQTEAMNDRTEELMDQNAALKRQGTVLKCMAGGALLFSLANLVLLILQILKVF